MRHGDEKDRAQKCAVNAAQAANDDHQQKINRLNDVELIGRQKPNHVGVQRPTHTGQRSRDRKAQRLVARQMNAHALGRDFAVANGHKSPPRGAAHQVHHGKQTQHSDHQANKVERLSAAGRPAKHLHRRNRHACVAPGDAVPARQHFFHDEAKTQGCNAQVNALHTKRRQAHDRTHASRKRSRCGKRKRKGPAVRRKYRLGVGPHAQKGAVAD